MDIVEYCKMIDEKHSSDLRDSNSERCVSLMIALKTIPSILKFWTGEIPYGEAYSLHSPFKNHHVSYVKVSELLKSIKKVAKIEHDHDLDFSYLLYAKNKKKLEVFVNEIILIFNETLNKEFIIEYADGQMLIVDKEEPFKEYFRRNINFELSDWYILFIPIIGQLILLVILTYALKGILKGKKL